MVEALAGVTLDPVYLKSESSLACTLGKQSSSTYRGSVDSDYWVFKAVKQAWSTVFSGENITEDSHFFELGGDSLQLMRIIGQIEQSTELRLTIKSCFENPRLSDQVTLLEMAILDLTDENELLALME